MRTLLVTVDKLFLQTKAAAEERQGIYFGEGLCLPSHAALTSAGAQGFGLGNGSGEGWWWSVGGGGTRHVAPRLGGWGRRMPHSGSCLALKSHLAPHPLPSALREGEGQVAGAGGMAWTLANGATRLVSHAPP